MALRVEWLELRFRRRKDGEDYCGGFAAAAADFAVQTLDKLQSRSLLPGKVPPPHETTNLELERTRGIRLFN